VGSAENGDMVVKERQKAKIFLNVLRTIMI
jgi:hypothetical protein